MNEEYNDFNQFEEKEKCSECGSEKIQKQLEKRDGGYFEIIIYCQNCGETQS